MDLEKLIEEIDYIEIRGDISNIQIKDISYNSKESRQGSLFVAIKGYITDGHKYIEDAVANGCLAVVVEEFQDIDIAQIKVSNSRVALADLSAIFFAHPSKDLFTVGITATNGKTTTAYMTQEIFKEANIDVGMVGTVSTSYFDISIPSILTTPESRDLQYYARDMVDRGISDLIMECSSHASEMYRIKNMDYDIITFNNISRDHIDQHGSFENYFKIKSRPILSAKEDSYAIINYDEDLLRDLIGKTKAKVLTYSFEDDTRDFFISNIDFSSGYPSYDFIVNNDIESTSIKKGSFKVQLGVAGYSSVMNSAVAIIISLIRGIDIQTIQAALENFKGVERRFQIIYDKEFIVVDDHYANSRNISVTMSTLEKMTYNKLHMVYAIRGCRGINLNREAAEESAKWLKNLGTNFIISTSSVETVGSKDRVSKEEKEIFDKVMEDNNIKVDHYDRLDDAIYKVLENVNQGDLILLAGCQGMDPGGRILLEKVSENLEENERKDILKVLDGRAF